ncbi:MAG: Lon protease family protein [Anaerolineales bacterium]
MYQELSLSQIYRVCDPVELGCNSSDEIQPIDTIIGQSRAVRALRFGLDIHNLGFNIYVSGIPGSGRTTATERYLHEFAAKRPTPDDWVYVNSFHDNLKPNAIRLPAGTAETFKQDMEALVENAIKDLKAAFESEEYTRHKESLINSYQEKKQGLLNQLGKQAETEGFVLKPTPMGLMSIPAKDGRAITEEEFVKLSDEEKEELSNKQKNVKAAMDEATRQAQTLDKDLRRELEELDQQVAEYAIQHHFAELTEKYGDLEEIPQHIEHVRQDILKNLAELTADEEEQPQPPVLRRAPHQDATRKYGINILVDNAELEGAPVILETNPTYANLIGRVEHEAVFGALLTDFTLIRPGALHRANGGFLVLPLEDLLRNPFSWEALKRSLENEKIEIEDISERYGFSTKSLEPEPIPLDTKVVLIGRPDLYHLLLEVDEKFQELFKVKADFDTSMDRTEENIHAYTAFVCNLVNRDHLRHLDQGALARLVEHGSRLVSDQEKLSTHFGDLSDVLREASYYAVQDGREKVTAEHIQQAIEERFFRSSLIRDRLQEMIARDVIKIETTGEKTGQVNGLSVISLGDIQFGQPSRITISLNLGKDGVIDIEREAELSGPIHTKGVLILSGYLAEKYARDKPLTLSARLVFEQNYSGVDGDSASSTELYALLSALSGLPIRQGIAVTGSVNQKGEVQAIGGVNQKVEGFFEVCQAKGLTGDQGVLIPEQNVRDLMLKEDVRRAVEAGKFHLWSVKHVDEGIELLTGVKAGQRQEDGQFEPDSVNALVDAHLRQMAEDLEQFGKEDDSEDA